MKEIAYLRFASKEQCEEICVEFGFAQSESGVITYSSNCDLIGNIYRDTNDTVMVDGVEFPKKEKVIGYHINLISVDDFPEDLYPFVVTPETPDRVYAGLNDDFEMSKAIFSGVGEPDISKLPKSVKKRAAKKLTVKQRELLDSKKVERVKSKLEIRRSVAGLRATVAELKALSEKITNEVERKKNYTSNRKDLQSKRDLLIKQIKSAPSERQSYVNERKKLNSDIAKLNSEIKGSEEIDNTSAKQDREFLKSRVGIVNFEIDTYRANLDAMIELKDLVVEDIVKLGGWSSGFKEHIKELRDRRVDLVSKVGSTKSEISKLRLLIDKTNDEIGKVKKGELIDKE